MNRHPSVMAESGLRFFPSQFGQQGVDEALVLAENLHQTVGNRLHRQRLAAFGNDLVHHVPQPDTPGVILHPPGLKSCILAAVGKADQLLMAIGGSVYHRLGQNVDIGHRDGLDLAGWFDDTSTDLERRGTARRAGRQSRTERHQRQERLLVAAPIGQASGRSVAVHGPALTAEPSPRPFCRP